MDKKVFTVLDIQECGYNLEPLKCLYCGRIGFISHIPKLNNWMCEYCGQWQIKSFYKKEA
jgi:DNA-directed RNA polymerase subunit RPC12/RpoP